jgi:hypothetical protein
MIISIKLKSGHDLLAELSSVNGTHIELINPIEVCVSPIQGLYLKNWIMFSDNERFTYSLNEIQWWLPSNPRGTTAYHEFLGLSSLNKTSTTGNEILDLLLEESKHSTKH